MANAFGPRIVLADDEPLFLNTTAELLRRAGFPCQTAIDAEGTLKLLLRDRVDLLIVDLNMPGNLDLELLSIGRRDYPEVPMIVVTGAPSLRSAIDSVKLQIADYLLKPIKFEDLLASVQRVLAPRTARGGASKTSGPDDGRLLGTSPAMAEVLDLIQRAAPAEANVLITGETGTGKELAALALHQASRRKDAPFVTVDCTAIPESLFESVLFGHVKGAFTGATSDQAGLLRGADGGTVFLDEIGDLPLVSQSKLLRLIQHATFTPVGCSAAVSLDVRFIAATNRDLAAEVERQTFRRDLYYRLAVVPISLPPLRCRGDDVLLLAQHYLRRFQSDGSQPGLDFSPAAIECLKAYAWPGNVRELRNAVERAVALARGTRIERSDLPFLLTAERTDEDGAEPWERQSPRRQALSTADRGYLEELLRSHEGNVSRAAVEARLTRQGLYKLLQKHGIRPEEFRR